MWMHGINHNDHFYDAFIMFFVLFEAGKPQFTHMGENINQLIKKFPLEESHMGLEWVNYDKNVYSWVNYYFKSAMVHVICMPPIRKTNWNGRLQNNIWMSKCVYLHFVHKALFKHKRKKLYKSEWQGSKMKNNTNQTKYSTMEKRINWTDWNKIAR